MTRDIYYIVGIKDEYKDRLSLTTINKEFCGRFDHGAYGVVWFELNGSGAWVAIPDEWIEWTAPSKVLWDKHRNNEEYYCKLCGAYIGEDNLKVCNKCASEYKV